MKSCCYLQAKLQARPPALLSCSTCDIEKEVTDDVETKLHYYLSSYWDGTKRPCHLTLAVFTSFNFAESSFQCDQFGQFIGLWATFKAFGNN